MSKKIYILRHAKAEAGSADQDDHSRKLVERGQKAAQIVGAYMFRHGIKPDKVLCSDAARTRQTWKEIESIYPVPMNVEFTRKIYLASANEILGGLTQLPDLVESVLVIGHNPSMHQICLKLAQAGDDKLLDILYIKFPTCSFASIDLGDISWADVMQAQGSLIDFVTPKMLAGIGDE